ncbi:MAG: isoprenylcysteine carboxylmethyltransferase family protein [Acidobacteriota bacterium]
MSDPSRSWTGRALARLARLRVALGFASGALVLWLAEPTAGSVMAGGAVACLGESLRIWAAGHLRKSREVTSSGPYRWTAHPLYVGSSVMGAGLAIASARAIVAALIAVYLIVTLTVAARTEEGFLRRTFGDSYDRYRSGDAAANRSGDPDRRFSLAQARANHEYRALIGLAVAMLLLAWKAARHS